MKKYYLKITFILFLISCSNEETKTQNQIASRPSIPILFDEVKIGDQTWKTQNLNTDHYRNGDIIPQVTNSTQWENLTTGAWCYYNNDPTNGVIYGKLYNWYAVNDPRGLAPEGWHVPSDAEWNTLIARLDNAYRSFDIIQSYIAGGKMKEASSLHWNNPNMNAINSSRFTALPSGARVFYGPYSDIGNIAYWWSTTENDSNTAWIHYVHYNYGYSYKYNHDKNNGISVRCIKN